MANQKISELTNASALAGTEEFPVVQGGETRAATIDQVSTALSATYAPFPRVIDVPAITPANVSNGTHTFVQNSGAFRGGYRSINNLNEYAEWIVPLDDGSWSMAIETVHATNNGGTIEVTVGGVVVATIDTSANSTTTRTAVTGITVASPGLVAVRCTVSTKAGGSSSYSSRLSGFTMALPGAL